MSFISVCNNVRENDISGHIALLHLVFLGIIGGKIFLVVVCKNGHNSAVGAKFLTGNNAAKHICTRGDTHTYAEAAGEHLSHNDRVDVVHGNNGISLFKL